MGRLFRGCDWMPTRTVLFPKYVTINNARLACLYWILFVIMIGFAIFQFVSKQRVFMTMYPSGDVSVNPHATRPGPGWSAAKEADLQKPWCTPQRYGWGFQGDIGCLRMCDEAMPGDTCMHRAELAQISPDSIFIPTFLTEEVTTFDEAACTGVREDGLCTDRKHFFVPGTHGIDVGFSHRFRVEPPRSILQTDRLDTGDSSKAEDNLRTVVLDFKGEKAMEFEPGSVIRLNVSQLLSVAKLAEYADTLSRPFLDEPYENVQDLVYLDEDSSQGPLLRMTGMTMMLDIQFSNMGRCQLDTESPVYRDESGGHAIACLSARVYRTWTSKERTSMLMPSGGNPANGGTLTRRYYGLRVVFTLERGVFLFGDFSQIYDGLTTILIWSQIPIFVLYFFVCTFLGQLSQIYNRVIHQEMSIGEAVAGFSFRMISHSTSFTDIADKRGGISLNRLLQRFHMIFKDNADLDEVEVSKFVDFVYDGILQADSATPDEGSIIGMREFVASCAATEPLSVQSLVDVFDLNRPLGVLERVFNDECVKEVRSSPIENDDDEDAALIRAASREVLMQSIKSLDQAMAAADSGAYEQGTHSHLWDAVMDARSDKKILQKLATDITVIEDQVKKRFLAEDGDELTVARPTFKFKNGSEYTGEWMGNKRHGTGLQQWPDGSRYEGRWLNDMMHGKGRFTHEDGSYYEGDWRKNKQQGNGVEVSSENMSYVGKFHEGLKHGKGKWEMPTGEIYNGQFHENRMHGEGHLKYPDGQSYQGQWNDGLMHGKGIYYYVDGGIYDGEFHEDQKHGLGVFEWPDGRQYMGFFSHNVKDGFGVYIWADGRRYEGYWKEGRQHGKGALKLKDGMIVSGVWEDGRKITAEENYSAECIVCRTCHRQLELVEEGSLTHCMFCNSDTIFTVQRPAADRNSLLRAFTWETNASRTFERGVS
mmetsp:Transcript_1297/g.3160  ORF Transcript_1297/g.3160 Transcript_1297/m.3160 type:complete len:932 (+) Transcript_1297:106-2901(+)